MSRIVAFALVRSAAALRPTHGSQHAEDASRRVSTLHARVRTPQRHKPLAKLEAWLQSEVLIPLDVVRSATDHDYIELAIAVEVDHLAPGSGHSHRV
jgi:hypothetical protein